MMHGQRNIKTYKMILLPTVWEQWAEESS